MFSRLFRKADTGHVAEANAYGSELLAFKHDAFLARHTALARTDVTRSIQESLKADLKETSVHNIALLMYYDTNNEPDADRQRGGLGPYLEPAQPVTLYGQDDMEVPTCIVKLVFETPEPDLNLARRALATSLVTQDFRIRHNLSEVFETAQTRTKPDWSASTLLSPQAESAQIHILERDVGYLACAHALGYKPLRAIQEQVENIAENDIMAQYGRILASAATEISARVINREIDITEFASLYYEAIKGARQDMNIILSDHVRPESMSPHLS